MAVEEVAYRVAEFAIAFGVCRSKAYELVALGDVPSFKVGASTRIPVDGAKAWMARKLAEQATETAA